MSAWGAPQPGSAWASQMEEKEAADAPAPVADSFPVLGAKEEAFPTLGAAKSAKKGKKQTMSLAEFAASPAGGGSSGSYRAPTSRAAVPDVGLMLPTGPRARAEGEDEQRQTLGGAFRDYGGDRGGDRGGARDFGDRDAPRRGGFGDREERDREGGVPDGPSRADEDRDWGASKRFVPSGPAPERRGADAGPPTGPSRADEDRDWGAGKRSDQGPPPGRDGPVGGFGRPEPPARREEVEADRWTRRGPEAAGPQAGAAPSTERPRLQLKPRSGDAPPPAAPVEARPAAVFGAAKPVAVRDVPDAPVSAAPAGPVSAPPSRPGPPGERPRLQLAPRSASDAAPAAGTGARAASVFGEARPREVALQAQGKDPRVEDLKQYHAVDRPLSEEEKALKAEVEAAEAAAQAEGADTAAKESARELALKLAKLTLELDDKVRFAQAAHKSNGSVAKEDAKWRKADAAAPPVDAPAAPA